jgi:prepilin-type N-terminal cleavage/methylation domain-containing protein
MNCFEFPSKVEKARKGLTLIELTVAVLILGILGAVALPRFQIAAEKAKAAEGASILMNLYVAQKRYYVDHGYYAGGLSDLDITFPSLQYFTIHPILFSLPDYLSRVYRQNPDPNLQYFLVIRTNGQIECSNRGNPTICDQLAYPTYGGE